MVYKKMEMDFGTIYLTANEKVLLSIQVEEPLLMKEVNSHKILDEAYRQLNEYFDKKRTAFNLPLQISGTDFQREVYRSLCNIEFGHTASYEDIAKSVKNPKAFRAVASVCARNKYLIIVPCHRVIRKNGELGGYSAGLKMKRYLMELERVL